MREADIQRKIIKYLEGRGAYVVRVMKASKAGVHDLVVCWGGQFITLEVKAPGGRVSELQEYHIYLVEKAGGKSFVVKSVQDVEAALLTLKI